MVFPRWKNPAVCPTVWSRLRLWGLDVHRFRDGAPDRPRLGYACSVRFDPRTDCGSKRTSRLCPDRPRLTGSASPVHCPSRRLLLTRRASLIVLLSTLQLNGCGSVPPPTDTGQARQAIEDGEIDDQALSVFRIITRSGGFNALCSSTLIAPNLLLTARHCVAETPSNLVDCENDEFGAIAGNDELLFANDTEPDLQSRWYAPARVAVPEQTTGFCGQDIALVVLAENVAAQVATPSAPRLSPELSVGEEYTAVGYGASADNAGTAEYGVRRSRSGLSIECLGVDCGVDVVDGEFAGVEGACRGDSGGPALDGVGRVMGALSRGYDGCESPVYTAAAAFDDWLVEVAGEAAELGNYPLPEWAGGSPVEDRDTMEMNGPDEAVEPESADAEQAPNEQEARLGEEGGCSLGKGPTPGRPGWASLWMISLLWIGRRRRSRSA